MANEKQLTTAEENVMKLKLIMGRKSGMDAKLVYHSAGGMMQGSSKKGITIRECMD